MFKHNIFGCVLLFIGAAQIYSNTLPQTNMAPKNHWFVDVSPFPRAYFQVLCSVSRRVSDVDSEFL